MKPFRNFKLAVLICSILFTVGQSLSPDSTDVFRPPICSTQKDLCSRSDVPKSRQKRLVTIPNLTTLGFSSRLIVPQPPIGVYIIWVKTRFFIRALFTESVIGSSGNAGSLAFSGRKLDTGEDDKKEVANDQAKVLERVERALDSGGISGRHCIQRAICELSETPVHDWSIVGEIIHNVLMPKRTNHTKLTDYQRAEEIGKSHGKCWKFFPDCPISIFNFIPDVYTKDDDVTVDFDAPEKELPVENEQTENLQEEIDRLFDEGKVIKEFNIDLDLTT